MLKRVFTAPDPGRTRLRFAARAVLGIGLAVVVCGLAGHSLTGAVTGGLAALLALFTVTDATVRGQAVTTALLPAVGLPVLTAAAVLHDHPVARDLAFLAVVGLGVYARRWGPRGHSLGVFAFMTYFVAQFLHATTGRLPELYASVLLSVLAAATVRFGLWCYERRLPPAVVPAPPGGTGLARVTTRQAVQATAGAGFALVVGQLVSGQRWYWAVGATWWVFVNTASRGETLVRGFRRVLGTVIGIGLALLVAVPAHGDGPSTALVVAVAVFGVFYTAAVSYTWMMLWVTVLAAMLYGLLGVLTPDLLALRLVETAVGALGAVLAVAFVLPVTTHSVTDAWIQRALRCVHACTAEAAARLAGTADADPAPTVAELEQLLARVRLSVAPLVHPLNPCSAASGGPGGCSTCSTTAPGRSAVSSPSPPTRRPRTTPGWPPPAGASRPPSRRSPAAGTSPYGPLRPGRNPPWPTCTAWSAPSPSWPRRCGRRPAPRWSEPDPHGRTGRTSGLDLA
ncbi:FUSC family protein [Streptomyces heliomycini]